MRRYASLRGRREFSLVVRRGRATSTKHLVLFSLLPPRSGVAGQTLRRSNTFGRSTTPAFDRPMMRVGIVISKKVGTAVERNRLRRRCKAILDESSIAGDAMWHVVQFRPAAAQLSYAQLQEQLKLALASSAKAAGNARRSREAIGS